jgi:hypothetical protein
MVIFKILTDSKVHQEGKYVELENLAVFTTTSQPYCFSNFIQNGLLFTMNNTTATELSCQ